MQWLLVCLLIISSLISGTAIAQPTSGLSAEKQTKSINSAVITQPPHSSQNMWKIIANNFSLSHYANTPDVKRQIKWFQTHQKYFDKIANQGQPYMYYIYQEVKKRKLPGELVLLPMIESAYDPFAYSWVGAAGLWQMMPATGANFGLKQDWWYDGRKDIVSSTSAALDYLTYLETFFNGNWTLAIAAYNSGEGTVQNAIDRNARKGRNTTFWALNLPAETENYVPRLLALAAIISNPDKYGVTLPPVHYGPYFKIVSLKQQIDLSQAAKMAGIPLGELYELNPGYNRWATDPKGPYRLLLPINSVTKFETKYAMQFGSQGIINANSPSNSTTKAILANTTERNGNGIEQAMINGKTPTPTGNSLNIGQQNKSKSGSVSSTTAPTNNAVVSTIKPSPSTKSTAPITPAPSTTKATVPIKTTIHYKIKAGDTLWSIAKHFNVTVGQLRTWNKLSEKNKIKVGQALIIEQPKQ